MMICRYDTARGWRVVSARHDDDCRDDSCRGCQRCTERHCIVCAKEHLDAAHKLTCVSCIDATRQMLAEIVWLAGQLPLQAALGGDDGRLTAGAPIPGADATVLLGPGSDGRGQTRAILRGDDSSHAMDEYRGDPEPPLQLLASWEDDWRLTFRHGAGPRATLARAVDYLSEHLDRAAQEHLAFDEFAASVRSCRTRLEDVLHAGERDESGAPCVHCGTNLVRATAPPRPRATRGNDQGGLRDEWKCPRCRRVYDMRSYWNATRAAYLAHASAMTDRDIEAQYGIPRGTVRRLASTGAARRRGKDARGRQLYDVEDVTRHAGNAALVRNGEDV